MFMSIYIAKCRIFRFRSPPQKAITYLTELISNNSGVGAVIVYTTSANVNFSYMTLGRTETWQINDGKKLKYAVAKCSIKLKKPP